MRRATDMNGSVRICMNMWRSRLRELLVAVTAMSLLLPAIQPAQLAGEHVCHREENYTVTSRDKILEPVEIHTLTWCLQIPPRCLETRTEFRERWRTKTEVKYKSVPVCCEGYKMIESPGNVTAEAKCVPHCSKKCLNGVCVAPDECQCNSGFHGQDCADECSSYSWGPNCENSCDCPDMTSCNSVTGKCNECPVGRTGSRCESKCPEGKWGVDCKKMCLCENLVAQCDHMTGACIEPDTNSPIDPFEASGISVNLVPTAKTGNTDYVDIIDFDKEAMLPRVTENESETAGVPSLPDEMIPAQSSTTEGLSTKTIEEKPVTRRPTSPLPAKPTTATTEGNQLSHPDSAKKTSFDFDDRQSNFRVIVSPKTDYVKTTHKGGSGGSMSAIPIDVAAMIVVGAIVSIGLTSVAALMIFHVRSRLLKAALAIYNQEKVERHFTEKDNAPAEGLDLTIGTLPRTMTRVNPVYNATSDTDSAILTFNERPAEYANGTVTIGIRLSSNLRDLLESHYDRPAACSHRSALANDTDVEHVYDEIPLSMPFYKDT